METRFRQALGSLFAARDGGALAYDDTKAINAALAQADASDIPASQVQSVMDYIDARLSSVLFSTRTLDRQRH